MNNKNVGVVGLGAMGLGIARSLLRSGFNVHACDVRTAVTEQFAGEGGVACLSPSHMAAECDVIITCLLYTSPSPRDLSTSRMPSSA